MFALMLPEMKQPHFEGQSHEWTVVLFAEFICFWVCHF